MKQKYSFQAKYIELRRCEIRTHGGVFANARNVPAVPLAGGCEFRPRSRGSEPN